MLIKTQDITVQESDRLLIALGHYNRIGRIQADFFKVSIHGDLNTTGLPSHDVEAPLSVINLYHPPIQMDTDSFALDEGALTGHARIGKTDVQIRIVR
jgi:hypothetical protein